MGFGGNLRAHSGTGTASRRRRLGGCVLALLCLSARQAVAFKPAPEFGHPGIIREALTPITRKSTTGETMSFSARAIQEIRDATSAVDDVTDEFTLPLAHCDDETLLECSQRILTIKNDIIANLASE